MVNYSKSRLRYQPCLSGVCLRLDLGEGAFWGLVTFAMTFGSLSEIANMASSIAVGKDWVMVIAGSHSQVSGGVVVGFAW